MMHKKAKAKQKQNKSWQNANLVLMGGSVDCHNDNCRYHSDDKFHDDNSVMMTSSNGNIFRFTGPLWEESIGHRWVHRTKSSDAEFWCFLFICAWINGWANNRDAGDLRRHRADYDVTVMVSMYHSGNAKYRIPNTCQRVVGFPVHYLPDMIILLRDPRGRMGSVTLMVATVWLISCYLVISIVKLLKFNWGADTNGPAY